MKLNKYYTAALTILTMIFLSGAIRAANYVVTNTNDSSTVGSLRNAITSANNTLADDTITFAFPANTQNCTSGGVCTIALPSGQLVINSAVTAGRLTITNASGVSKLIFDGNNASRIFYVSGGADLTLDGITVTRGSGAGSPSNGYGGGIFSDGNLTITNSSISGSNVPQNGGCGGIASNGTLTLVNSSVSNNTSQEMNGGICSIGALKIESSTVSYNTAKIANSGISTGAFNSNQFSTAIIKNSTINNNTVQMTGSCGGIQNFKGFLTIENSTVSNNTSPITGGGICHFQGTLTINNSTISGNSAQTGGGIFESPFGSDATNTYIRNTIVAANTGTNGQPDIRKADNTFFTSRGNNLIGNSTDTQTAIIWNTAAGTADILNQSPQLAPLSDNGGETQTQALLVNSPAVNAGNDCVLSFSGCSANDPANSLTLDQRGFYRSGRTDIGAFEYGGVARKTLFDFDADRKADLSVFRPSNAVWYLLNSTSGFSAANWGLSTDKLTPADFDGDGRTDLAVWRESEGNFYILNSSNNSIRIENFGLAGDKLMVGDWDGDGKADLSTYRDGAQSYFFYRGSLNNPNGNVTFLPWGISGDKPQRGDFDGDGKQDAAIYRASNQTWYIRNSSNGLVSYQTFGLSTDIFVPADYDGDGKTDTAVFRPSNSVWYILQSSNNQVRYERFGLGGDNLLPADYDGDGKADVSVFRNGV